MKAYLFVINCEPAIENRYHGKVGGADAHVCVMDIDADIAEQRAINIVRQKGWIPTEIEYAFVLPVERLHEFHESTVFLYYRAVHQGIAVDFVGCQAEEHPGDPVLIVPPC